MPIISGARPSDGEAASSQMLWRRCLSEKILPRRISKMSPLTIFLGEFLGLSYFIICAVCMARPKAVLDASKSLVENTGLLLVSGIFTMAGGVAMVIGHNIWSGDALPIAVTVLGWLMLAKGVALMAMPPRMLAASYAFLNTSQRFRLVMIPATVFSAWVTLAAFNV
jgi:hypothetical protein